MKKAACFWTDLYPSNLQLTLWTLWCNAFSFAILHFCISANFEPTCQGPLVLLLFLSDLKGSHSPIDFFMSPGWRSDHGLAARRPNAQHMQRRENWEEMFPKSNVKTYIICRSSPDQFENIQDPDSGRMPRICWSHNAICEWGGVTFHSTVHGIDYSCQIIECFTLGASFFFRK